MAYQVGPFCYASALDAVAAMASSQVGAVVVKGSVAYVVDVGSYTASSITYALRPVDGGAVISSTTAVAPLPCGLLDWQDGLALGWGVALVWLAVAAVMFVRRGMHE
ncbi:MAG: hypothetical protein Q7J75_01610 [Rhodoferax sp.]|nr:hypothetical protein [Rhodoferax sp.]